ncbi:MAG: hypothetical protein ACP6IQ_07460 [Candidatus Njordarchaeia archaeon]
MPSLNYLFDKILEVEDQINCVDGDDKLIAIGCVNGDIIVISSSGIQRINVNNSVRQIAVGDGLIVSIDIGLTLNLFKFWGDLLEKIHSCNLRDYNIKEMPRKIMLLKNKYDDIYPLFLLLGDNKIIVLGINISSVNAYISCWESTFYENIADFDIIEGVSISLLYLNRVEFYDIKEFLDALRTKKTPQGRSYFSISGNRRSMKMSPKLLGIVLLTEKYQYQHKSYNLIWIPNSGKELFSFNPDKLSQLSSNSIIDYAFSSNSSYLAVIDSKFISLYSIRTSKEEAIISKMYSIEIPINVNGILWHSKKVILWNNKVLLAHDIDFADKIFSKIINPLRNILMEFSNAISQDNFNQATQLTSRAMLLLASNELLNTLQKVGITEAKNLLKGTIIPDEYLKAAEEIINKTLKSKEIVPKERQIIGLLKDVLIEVKESVKKPEKLSEILINVADISSEALGLTITSPVWTIASFLVPILFIIRNKLRETE